MRIHRRSECKPDGVRPNLFGSKNASIFLLIACIARAGAAELANVPIGMEDVDACVGIASSIRKLTFRNCSTIIFSQDEPQWDGIDLTSCGRIRHSLLLMPLAALSLGKVVFPMPGGCDLNGSRPINFHRQIWSCFGIHSSIADSLLILSHSGEDSPGEITLPFPSVGASAAVLLLAAFTGKTLVINNIAKEPEVSFLLSFLQEVGIQATIGARCVTVSNGWDTTLKANITIPPDRINIITNCVAAAISRSSLVMPFFALNEIQAEIKILVSLGVVFRGNNERHLATMDATGINNDSSILLNATCYPGVATDSQPLFAALACTLHGDSQLSDSVYPKRFEYIDAFRALGVSCNLSENVCYINGLGNIGTGEFRTRDIRSSMAIALLGIASEHGVTIASSQQLKRGYLQPAALLSNFSEVYL